MLKNNFWNRLFHKRAVLENKTICSLYEQQCLEGQRILDAIDQCDSLIKLLDIHKDAYNSGFKTNIGPCPYGIVRSLNMKNTTPDQVYLGGIWGLFTHNISYWENHKEEEYGTAQFNITPETKVYSLILKQYKIFLTSNVEAMFSTARTYYPSYKEAGY